MTTPLNGLLMLTDQQTALLRGVEQGLDAAALAALAGACAGQTIDVIGISPVQRAVARMKAGAIGVAATAAVEAAAANDSLTDEQRFDQVLSAIAPEIYAMVDGAGVSDAESIARELVQSGFNDTVSSTASAVAAAVLAMAPEQEA